MFKLDHAVINVRDRMDGAAALYERMGFTLTPRGFHTAGSINHLMVFERDYLELLGFPPGKESVRPELAESPVGLDAVVFDLPDPDLLYREAGEAGFPVQPPSPLARPVEIDGRTEEARFTTVRLPRSAFEGGRVYFCHHHTPQFIWRPLWQQHANGAAGIASLTIAAPEPSTEAARYARLLGVPPDAAAASESKGARVAFSGYKMVFVSPPALREQLGGLAPDPRGLDGTARRAYMAMITFNTRSVDAARSALRRGGFNVAQLGPGTVAVPAADAMNVTLAFSESAAG